MQKIPLKLEYRKPKTKDRNDHKDGGKKGTQKHDGFKYYLREGHKNGKLSVENIYDNNFGLIVSSCWEN